jgi:hypothetical protein
MATYSQIQKLVRAKGGFTPKPCWIAHVMSDHGLTKRVAFNRIDPDARKHPRPPQKRQSITDALRELRMIP